MYQRIMVPVDGSHTSTLGLQEAIRIAVDQRARLKLISIVDGFIIAQNFEGLTNAGNMIDALRESSQKAIATALALASGVILGQYLARPLKREAHRLETRLAGPRMVGPIRRHAGKHI